MKEAFRKAASKVSVAAGYPITFLGALSVVILWAVSGRFFVGSPGTELEFAL